MESWLSVGPRYNLHYIYLPGFVVLPKCRRVLPHRNIRPLNDLIQFVRRRGRGGVDSTNLTPPDSFTLRNSSLARVNLTALPQRFNTFHCPPSIHPPFATPFVRYPSLFPSLFNPLFRDAGIFSLRSAPNFIHDTVMKIIVSANGGAIETNLEFQIWKLIRASQRDSLQSRITFRSPLKTYPSSASQSIVSVSQMVLTAHNAQLAQYLESSWQVL